MIAALCFAWIAFQAPVDLKLGVRVGDAWVVEVRERYLNVAQEFDETDVWVERGKVLKVGTDGADAEIVRELKHTEINGDAVPPAKGTKPDVRNVRLRAIGGLVPRAASTPRERSLARADALAVVFRQGPTPVGASWECVWPQVDQVPRAKAVWTFRGVEEIAGRSMAAVAFRFDEDAAFDRPMRIEGTRWVDIETGLVLQERSTAHGLPVPGGSFLVDLVTTTTLTSFRRVK